MLESIRQAVIESKAPATPKVNGKPKSKMATKVKAMVSGRAWDWTRFAAFQRYMLAMAMPVFALCLAKVAATLVQGNYHSLGGIVGAVGIGCLAVSLADCKQSIKRICGVEDWQAWALAITVDLCVVVGELVLCFAPIAGLDMWVGGLMGTVGLFSMGFNAYAFHMNTSTR